jgi:glutamate-5-semialdehyde dehydrogenase
MTDLAHTCEQLARRVRLASRLLATVPRPRKDDWLLRSADRLVARQAELLAANERDISGAREAGISRASLDRLRLTPKRIDDMAVGLRQVASLPDPVGQIRESVVRPNGLQIHKVGVPLGVVLFIYESRPNVTVDAAALCVKSGNAVLLRGGREALYSNVVLHAILTDCLTESGLPPDAVGLVTVTDRAAVGHLLQLRALIDLAIPRGGEGLIRRVAEEAKMPVLKHYQGICHVYIERSADPDMAERIVVNSKCQRPGVCNAAECLLIDRAVADTLLPRLALALTSRGVELRGCPRTCELIPDALPAREEDYDTEFLDLKMAVKVVDGLSEAARHIAEHGSGHTDTIVTRDLESARGFTTAVDSAAVVVNASTRFHDGFEFGLGAEIGISTDKFHARGPCGLLELTSYKYVVYGEGQVRE